MKSPIIYKPEGTNIPSDGGVTPSVYIMPYNTSGVTPFNVNLTIMISGGNSLVTEYALNTGDDNIIVGKFDKYVGGETSVTINHTYTNSIEKTSTFYPDVTIYTKDGGIKTMNCDGQKKCSIWVHMEKPTTMNVETGRQYEIVSEPEQISPKKTLKKTSKK